MSLITRCPACKALFKVVPDQLRIAQGWVRCGDCAEVFDASGYLENWHAATPSPLPLLSPSLLPIPTSELFGESASSKEIGQVVDDEPVNDDRLRVAMPQAPVDRQLMTAGQDMPPDLEEAVAASGEEPVGSVQPQPASANLYPPFVLRRPEAGDALSKSAPPAAEDLEKVAPVTRPAPAGGLVPVPAGPVANPKLEPAPEELSFVRQARRHAFWHGAGARAVLLLAMLTLAGALALQWVVQERNWVAAAQPELRPWLERLCVTWRCSIGPPRQIEAIVIDSSSFSKLRGDAYRLNFILKNQADTAVATPALELTLTDSQDQPVLRRVLRPSDFMTGAAPGSAPANAVIAASADWSGTLTLSLVGTSSVGRIAGYRLLAFYP